MKSKPTKTYIDTLGVEKKNYLTYLGKQIVGIYDSSCTSAKLQTKWWSIRGLKVYDGSEIREIGKPPLAVIFKNGVILSWI